MYLLFFMFISCGAIIPREIYNECNPLDSEPLDSEPLDSEPLESEPLDSEPLDSEPLYSEPLDSEPLNSEPLDSEPLDSEYLYCEPLDSEPLYSEPLDSEPLNSEPLDSEPLDSEPLNSEYLDCEYSDSKSLDSRSFETEALGSPAIPPFWDWREYNVVSPVKDQGNCGACWAFSAVGNVESHLKLHLNREETLSEQFLIDCDPDHTGCGVKSILKVFSNMVLVYGGVLRQSDYYPYTNNSEECRWDKNIKPVPVIGYRRVLRNEEVMAEFLYEHGPLSAGINSASMRLYKGGIDEPSDELCPPDTRDHAVLIVGYTSYVDNKNNKTYDYWIIKNSWGTEWGDDGFYYLIRGRNACGIAEDVAFSFVD